MSEATDSKAVKEGIGLFLDQLNGKTREEQVEVVAKLMDNTYSAGFNACRKKVLLMSRERLN